ncbi:efflux RND transporter periplasmic adaptor subunit [Microscilla marina]|uniref:Efflux transporter, RND family, MFP subunit n=1 Tax=Microscilla marina ATCC 23134 TaxID=313606 RepID=A1ZZN5_MICM2|nr:efflux RND transporter periplasmic adaptor subunit [Microscilla marina]EAY24143.1 efflux transporter, RND family, MFP subunit [Microscilla marina ATCC 23134]
MQRSYPENNPFKQLTHWTLVFCCLLAGCKQPNVTSPRRTNIVDAVFASGHIAKDHEYLVAANTEGYIVKSFAQEGDKVTANMPLFQLSNDVQSARLDNALVNYRDAKEKLQPSSPQLMQLQIQIAQAKAQLKLDAKNLERYTQLVETNAVSQLEYDQVKLKYDAAKNNVALLEKSLDNLKSSLQLQLENAQSQLKIQRENHNDYYLKATTGGVLLKLLKKEGELVRRGQHLAKIGSGREVIKLYVAEEDIGRVKVGQMAKISLNTHKNEVFDAKVTKVYPAFDDKEQSFLVEAVFLSKPTVLLAGTQLQANIVVNKKQHGLTIPAAFLQKGDRVILADTKKEVKVQVGIRNNGWVEITKGIDEHSRIVESK